jgi:aspartate/methionine/tyrosine aminotransferase
MLNSRTPLRSKLPSTGVSIFAVMSRLALEHNAINLSQGFPDFDCAPELVDAVARYMREGHNQYAPMPGVPALRDALAFKIERLYGRRYDPGTEITVTSGAPRRCSPRLRRSSIRAMKWCCFNRRTTCTCPPFT